MFPDVSRLPTLATGRLRLRELGTRDVDALYAVFSDAEVMRYWSRPAFATRDEAVEYLEHIHRGRAQRRLWQWGIATSDDDVVIGTCTLFANDGWRAEIGFALGRTHWGRGYAREAVACVVAYAFDTLRLHRLEADIDPRNAASCALVERFGFRLEGRLRERYCVAGDVQDTALYGLLATDRATAIDAGA